MSYILRCMLELLKSTTPNGSISSMSREDVLVGMFGFILLFAIILFVLFLIKRYLKKQIE